MILKAITRTRTLKGGGFGLTRVSHNGVISLLLPTHETMCHYDLLLMLCHIIIFRCLCVRK